MVSNLPGCGLLVSVVLRAPGAAGRPEGLGVGPEQGLGPEGAEERRIPASSGAAGSHQMTVTGP